MQKCNSCGTINSDMYCKVYEKELDQNNSHELNRIDTIGDIFRNIENFFSKYGIKFKSENLIKKVNETQDKYIDLSKKSNTPIFCSDCGEKIESENTKFCKNCGKKINAQVVNNTIYEKMNSVELQKRIIYIAYGILMLILILVTFIIPIGDFTIMEKLKIINKDLINEILGIFIFSSIGFMLIHVIFDNNTKNKKLSYLLLFLGINFLLYSIRLLINITPTLGDILKPYFLEGHITLLLLIYVLCSIILILIPLNSYTLTNKIRFLLMIYMLFFIFY